MRPYAALTWELHFKVPFFLHNRHAPAQEAEVGHAA